MMNYLSQKEIEKKEVVVDSNYGWHFPKGDVFLKKAKRLIKNNYIIVNYEKNEIKEVSINFIVKKINDCKTYGMVERWYNELKEYVDRKNKVYYISFGDLDSCSMWC